MNITHYFNPQLSYASSIEFRFGEQQRFHQTFSDEVIYEALTNHLRALSQSIQGLHQRIDESLKKMNTMKERK